MRPWNANLPRGPRAPRAPAAGWLVLGWLTAAWLTAACAGPAPATAPDAMPDPAVPANVPAPAPPSSVCPAVRPATFPLPAVEVHHLDASWWLDRWQQQGLDLDAPLMDADAIDRHREGLLEHGHSQDLRHPLSDDALAGAVAFRLQGLREREAAAELVDARGQRLPAEVVAALADDRPGPRLGTLHAAREGIPLRCAPTRAAFYTPSLDLRLDRNRCHWIRPQDPMEVLAEAREDMFLVRTPAALGWIPRESLLSAPWPTPGDRAWTMPSARGLLPAALDSPAGPLPAGTTAPLDPTSADRILLGLADGWQPWTPPAGTLRPQTQPLTRRAWLHEVFRRLDEPYGWGGTDGGWDCSDHVQRVGDFFGLGLPRFSGHQAQAGVWQVEVPAHAGTTERLALLDAALAHGIVLLHFPGHIFWYLGRNEAGEPMAIHSFAEYVQPCETPDGDRTETLVHVDRVTVSDLRLGAGSSRRDFLARITRISVLGGGPSADLAGAVHWRSAAPLEAPPACPEGAGAEGWEPFVSPLRPSTGRPLRLLAVGDSLPGALRASAWPPSGRPLTMALRRTSGPPWGLSASFTPDQPGTWTLALHDGPALTACRTVQVSVRTEPWVGGGGGAWPVRNRWTPAMERLFALWVESLFDYPLDQDLTWTNLQSLLVDETRNVLFDHYGHDEDRRLRLAPDCADLPYLLRGYFAWKLGLPFGYRTCSRGGRRQHPTCQNLQTQADASGSADPVRAFQSFMNQVRNGVHSGAGRTHPEADDTDWYPVTMTREGIRPGTMYADPYGHLMVVTRWVPQQPGAYGILMAADAQPDATIGRPRFWRGTFLFTPSLEHVGAGFKAWRPLVAQGGGWRSRTNAELRGQTAHSPFGMDQYEGTVDDFYARMESLIDPRPLDADARLVALVDALHEAARRRVVSIENGSEWQRRNPGQVAAMPEGSRIFLTVGPWEDFSTPSRDMRMLIAIDTVMGFADTVARSPERFGLSPAAAPAAADALRRRTADLLAERTFTWLRSDGTPWTTDLATLAARAPRLELAWNPNDCPEWRWGAEEGTDEYTPCRRRAPADQQARMRQVQSWFSTRERPVR